MTITTRVLACAALITCLLVTSSAAKDDALGPLVVSRTWSRATPSGAKVASGYLTIENRGHSAERLISVSTAAAKRAEIHEMAVGNGVMTMRPVDGLVIESGRSISLAPGGAHLMFLELTAPFRQGEQVPATLVFEHAGAVSVAFNVQGVGAQSFEPKAPAPARAEQAVQPPAAVTSDADDSFFTHLHAVKAMANVTVSPGRAGPVEIAIQLENADELPLAADAVSVTLGNPEQGVAPVTANAERIYNDHWLVKMSAPLPGRWSLGLGITLSASDMVNVESPILLK
jgi:copper(I)-binding protein